MSAVRQDDLSVLRRLVAAVAHLVLEGVVQKRLHQLRLRRLVRVVALQAVCRSERLALMRLLQRLVLRVVAIDAERRNRLLQMCRKFDLSTIPILMGHVAGIAAHVESGVTAAAFGHVHADLVAGEAEILVSALRPDVAFRS